MVTSWQTDPAPLIFAPINGLGSSFIIAEPSRGSMATAAGVSAISDATETAVRIHAGRIIAQADGYGACHAAATV
jgi:hypothetical protein